jgi:hypothetical protein
VEEGYVIRMRIPAITAIIAPAIKPPPMKKLTMAVGKIMNAASMRNPRRIIRRAPASTRPSTTPSMKANDPSEANHGKKELHITKKLKDRSATPLRKIKAAATPTSAGEIQENRLRKGVGRYGPYHPGGLPKEFAGGGDCAAPGTGIIAGIGAVGTVWKQFGHNANPLYGLLQEAQIFRPQR